MHKKIKQEELNNDNEYETEKGWNSDRLKKENAIFAVQKIEIVYVGLMQMTFQSNDLKNMLKYSFVLHFSQLLFFVQTLK